jgi:hypothetical protein
LFCWLADRRALGLGRREHATGPVQASILKKCRDEHLRPACWYPLRSGSLRSPPRSGYQHAAFRAARRTNEMCNTCVCLKCNPCVCPLPSTPLSPPPLNLGFTTPKSQWPSPSPPLEERAGERRPFS